MTTDTSININNNFQFAILPVSIIWPEDPNQVPWFMARLYEQMAFAINARDFTYFPMAISVVPTPIENLNNFGAYLLCVGGTDKIMNTSTGVVNWLPSYVWPLAKTKDTVAGTIPAPLTSQVGAGDIWAGATLTLTSQTINGRVVYAINHNKTGLTGSFNIRIVGTQ